MKKIVIILALVLTSSTTFAQDAPAPATPEAPASKFTAAVDIVYPYLWRGIALTATDKPAVQPYASYAFTDKLTLGTWLTTNVADDVRTYNELDFYVSYQVSPIVKLMLSNYYVMGTTKNFGPKKSFFNFGQDSAQDLDLSVLLNFADKGIPLDFQWNTIIAGIDPKADGSRAFSSYAEAGYTISLKEIGIDLRPFLGAAVINENGFYGRDKNGKAGFALTNVGLNASKSIKISENYSIPLFVRYTYNQNGNANKNGDIKNSFISGGATFKIF